MGVFYGEKTDLPAILSCFYCYFLLTHSSKTNLLRVLPFLLN